MRRSRLAAGLAIGILAVAVLTGCGGGATPGKGRVTVFAAASLQPAFTAMARHIDLEITFNFAGSQTLATQIDQGAQADVFASADQAHMTAVQNAGLLDGSPQLFAHNKLEIAVAGGNPKGIHSLADLARPGLVVVLADPSVPAGRYAQQALANAGVKVKPASLELDVTAVLNKVVLGEADAGIVYSSDVVTSGHVDGVPIPDGQNIVADYPIAILKDAPDRASAQTFVRFVLSAEGQSQLSAAGFARA